MIEQRYPCLEGVGHAHTVELRQDVSGQIRLEVETLETGQRVKPLCCGQ